MTIANWRNTWMLLFVSTVIFGLGFQATGPSRLWADSDVDKIYSISKKAHDAFMSDDFKRAQPMFEQAAELSVEVLGPNDLHTLNTIEFLALTCEKNGDNQRALELMWQVIAAKRKTLGDDHPETLRSRAVLARTYEALGDLNEALKVGKQVYEGRKAHLGPFTSETLQSAEFIAGIHQKMGDIQKSLETLELVCDIKMRLHGQDHAETEASLRGLVEAYGNRGEYGKALGFARQLYALYVRKYGTDHNNTINYLEYLGGLYASAGEPQKALECNRQVYESRKNRYGPDDPYTIGAMAAMGANFSALGDHQRALELKKAAWQAMSGLLFIGPNEPASLEILDSLADTYHDIGDRPKALELKRKVWQGLVIFSNPYNRITLWRLEKLADAHMAYGDHRQAAELYQQLLDTRKKKLGPAEDDPDTLISLYKLAEALSSLGEDQQASVMKREFNEICRRELNLENEAALNALQDIFRKNYTITSVVYFGRGRSDELIDDLENVKLKYNMCVKLEAPNAINCLRLLNQVAALTDSEVGDIHKALDLQRQVWEAMEQILTPSHEETLAALHSLAAYHQQLGDYQIALEMNQKVFEKRKMVLGLENEDTAASLINLGAAYSSLGQYEMTLELYREAMEILKKILGPDDVEIFKIIRELADTYGKTGDQKNALDLHRQAWIGLEKVLGAEHPETLSALARLAATYNELGEHQKSLELNLRLLEAAGGLWGSERPEVLNSQYNLAQSYAGLKEYEKATALLKEAITGLTREFGLYHPQTAAAIMSLAEISHKIGQPEAAVFYARWAVETVQVQRRQQETLERELRESYLAKVEKYYQLLASWLLQAGRPEEALEVLRLLKDDELAAMADQAARPLVDHKASGSVVEDPAMAEFARLGEVLAHARQEQRDIFREYRQEAYNISGITKDETIQKRTEVEGRLSAAQKTFQVFLDQLPGNLNQAAQRRAYQDSSRRNQEARQKLLEKFGDGTVIINTFCDEDNLYLFLTTNSGLIVRQSPVGAKEMAQKVAAFQPLLRSPGFDPRPAAHDIYKSVISPLADDLITAQPQTLLFSVDGPLRYIPLATLYSGQKWLVEDYAVVMFTEAAREKLSGKANYQVRAAALGLTEAKDGLAALPAVHEELNQIVRGQGENVGILPGQKLLDNDFNYNTLSASLREDNQILHLASHFVFRPQAPNQSYLLLGDGSKLILANLSVDDNLPFQKLDLLTLSACDTASGLARGSGREVEGLAALALMRGASTVVATLWPIADDSTGRFMSDFYRLRFNDKLSKAEALRQSQLNFIHGRITAADMRTETRGKIKIAPSSTLMTEGQTNSVQPWTEEIYAHPYFWAPFILMGDWK